MAHSGYGTQNIRTVIEGGNSSSPTRLSRSRTERTVSKRCMAAWFGCTSSTQYEHETAASSERRPYATYGGWLRPFCGVQGNPWWQGEGNRGRMSKGK